ncbi:MAG: MFS transporter [Marmoricola sp.]
MSAPSALAEPTVRPGKGWVAGMCLLNAGIMVAFFVPIQVLLAQQSELIVPGAKEVTLAWTTAAGALASTIFNPVWGALSDRTLSRFGRRVPWVFAGALASAAALLFLSTAVTLPVLVIGWVLCQTAINAIFAPIVAAVPDQVPVATRGVVGGLVAMSQTLGVALGSAIPMLTDSIRTGYIVVAVILVVSAVPYLLHSRDVQLTRAEYDFAKTRDEQRRRLPIDATMKADFRWAFITRFLMQFGNALMLLFMLYFLQDGLGMGRKDAEGGVFLLTAVYALMTVITAVIGGIASDRMGKRKPFVIGSGLVVAVSFVVMMMAHSMPIVMLGAVLMGLGFGMYQAVDFALITQVLPDADGRGRDMGILNIASALPQVAAPLISILLISGYGVSYPLLFLAAAIVSVLGSVLVLKIKTVD